MRSAFDSNAYDVVRGVVSLDRAREDFLIAEQYYHGDPKEVFGNSKDARALEKNSQGFKIRFSKKPIDVMLNRMKISSINVANDEATDKLIAQIRHANNGEINETEIHKNVFLYGSAYVLVAGVDENDLDEKPAVREAGAKLALQSVYNCRAIYDDLNQDAEFIIRSIRTSDEYRICEVYYHDGMVRYVTVKPDTDGHEVTDWKVADDMGLSVHPDNEEVLAPVITFGEEGLPIKHFRNGFTYGRPEHRDAYEPQNAIIKYLTTGIIASSLAVHPQRYTWTDPKVLLEAKRDNGYDEDHGFDYYGRDENNLPLGDTQEGGPGTIMDFPGVSGVGTFDPADPTKFSDPIDSFLRWMAEATDTPLYTLDTGGEQPSGTARQIMDEPLADKCENRQLWLSGSWSEVYEYALALLGVNVSEVVIKWKPAGVVTDKAFVETLLLTRQLGISDKALIIKLGYTDDEADDFLAENADELGIDYKIEQAGKAAEALSKFAPLVAAGLMTAEQFAELATSLLGEITRVHISPDDTTTDVQGPTQNLEAPLPYDQGTPGELAA